MTTQLSPELLELLRERNPFSSDIAPEPWSNQFVDIPEINKKAFDVVRGLIAQQRKNPSLPLAGLILGEPGSGKTHLIKRIMKECRKEKDSRSLFVFVKPLFNPKQPLHHLLQEIVLSLSRNNEGENAHSQFDYFVASMMTEYLHKHFEEHPEMLDKPANMRFLEQSKDDVFHILSDKYKKSKTFDEIKMRAAKHFRDELPDVNQHQQFLTVLLQYTDKDKRVAVRDWLKGSTLDDDAYETLGLPVKNSVTIDHQTDESIEQEARTILLALGAVFAKYHFTLVLCFDQLDELKEQDKINGFGSMIYLLVNNGHGMLPLTFIRAGLWNDKFLACLDPAVIDRVDSNRTDLKKGCTPEQAEELIVKRIEQVFEAEKTEMKSIKDAVLFQWQKKSGGNLYSPREVIKKANVIVRALIDGIEIEPKQTFSFPDEYNACCNDAAVNFDSWDPVDSEYLKRAAALYLRSRLDNPLLPGENKYLTWVGKINDQPLACLINAAKNWQSVSATLERGIDFLKTNPNAVCTYVTDSRCDFKPSWKKIIEQRNGFEKLGGNVIILNQTVAVHWYGLVSLSSKLGDLGVEEKDLLEFLRNDFQPFEGERKFDELLKKGQSGDEEIDPPPPPDAELTKAICEILSPLLGLMKVDYVVQKLNDQNFKISKEVCLEHIGKRQDLFILLCSNTSVKLKKK